MPPSRNASIAYWISVKRDALGRADIISVISVDAVSAADATFGARRSIGISRPLTLIDADSNDVADAVASTDAVI